MPSSRAVAALVLLLAAAALAALLLFQHHGEQAASGAVAEVCGAGADSGCDNVNRSSWSEVGGVPLAAIGLFFYGALALLLALALVAGGPVLGAAAALAFTGVAAALVVDLLLLGVQAFAIRAFCKLCLLTYVLGGLALAALWPARTAARSLPAALSGREARLALAGWAAASVVLAGAVATGEALLDAREQARGGSLLGAPAGAPVPGDLASAQAEVKRLQGILDDPRKLNQYFADRSRTEYEQAPVQSFDLGATPVKGPADAPVKVVDFSDFLCPHCRNIANAFTQFLPTAQGKVAVYYRNYPLDQSCNPKLQATVHPGACLLALGGLCAHEQGKFWPYHDRVFANQAPSATDADLMRIAGEAGLDIAALSRCVAAQATRDKLAAEIQEGVAGQVAGTPTLFVNGKKLPRLEDFLPVVDRELQRQGLGGLPKPAPPQAGQH